MRKLVLTSMLLVTACSVGPDYKMPSIDLPSLWGEAAAEAKPAETAAAMPVPSQIPLDWWKLFNDPILTTLEEEGQKANADVLLAAARVAEARAVLHLTEANQYPEIDLQGGAERTSRSRQAFVTSGIAANSKPYNDFSVAAVLSFEIDLWGRLRRSDEAARAQLLSLQTNREAIQLAVASDIATGYFNLLALDAQVEVTIDTIKSRQASYDYQNNQYQRGAIDALTYREAEAELAAAQATLPQIQQAQVEQQNALAILLGRSPKELVEKPVALGSKLAAIPVPPAIPADVPSTLLRRRPDISAAEQDMIAANAQVGLAIADYYPTISLSALIGLDSANVDKLLKGSARNWALGGSLAAPLLDFGRTTANVDAAKARSEQTVVTYRQTVRNAFAEALNAMSATKTSEARVAAQTKQLTARTEANRVAGRRYDVGYSTHLELLDAQRALFQAQLDSVDAMRTRLSATVTLYKALGGGWGANADSSVTPPPTP